MPRRSRCSAFFTLSCLPSSSRDLVIPLPCLIHALWTKAERMVQRHKKDHFHHHHHYRTHTHTSTAQHFLCVFRMFRLCNFWGSEHDVDSECLASLISGTCTNTCFGFDAGGTDVDLADQSIRRSIWPNLITFDPNTSIRAEQFPGRWRLIATCLIDAPRHYPCRVSSGYAWTPNTKG